MEVLITLIYVEIPSAPSPTGKNTAADIIVYARIQKTYVQNRRQCDT